MVRMYATTAWIHVMYSVTVLPMHLCMYLYSTVRIGPSVVAMSVPSGEGPSERPCSLTLQAPNSTGMCTYVCLHAYLFSYILWCMCLHLCLHVCT